MNKIRSLGIKKSWQCPMCKRTNTRTNTQRKNLAECMITNCVGLWALETCGHCAYTITVYPVSINGVACTAEEAQLVHKAMWEEKK